MEKRSQEKMPRLIRPMFILGAVLLAVAIFSFWMASGDLTPGMIAILPLLALFGIFAMIYDMRILLSELRKKDWTEPKE